MTSWVWFFAKQILKGKAEQEFQKRKTLVLLKVLHGTRLSLIGLIALMSFFQLMIFGFIGVVVSAILVWPELEMATRMWILFSVSSFLFLVPFLTFVYVLSNRVWYKASGAEQMVHDLERSQAS